MEMSFPFSRPARGAGLLRQIDHATLLAMVVADAAVQHARSMGADHANGPMARDPMSIGSRIALFNGDARGGGRGAFLPMTVMAADGAENEWPVYPTASTVGKESGIYSLQTSGSPHSDRDSADGSQFEGNS